MLNEQELFAACLDLPHLEQGVFLERVCGPDTALRLRLERLLAAHERAERATLRPLDSLQLDDTPDVIGPYELIHVLGEGGMGVVYEAQQREPVQRRVALKVVKLGMDTRQVVSRFMAERQALAAMDHPFVAKVFDAGQTVSGRPYFVMELVRGEPLLEYCERARLTLRQRVELFILICQAVQHAHQKGVIHRDLKPSNLLVSADDGRPIPKIIDFGIAKAVGGDADLGTHVTRSGQTLGTLAYMSPEQAGGGLDVDTRADIYSLGVILYELLTGALPIDPKAIGESKFVLALGNGELEPPRPGSRATNRERVPADLDWIIMKALAADRTRRYDTALSFAEDLNHLLTNEPVVARPPTISYRAAKFVRRHRVELLTASFAALALIGGSVSATIGMVRANRAEALARQEAATAQRVSDFLTGLFGASDPNAQSSTTLRQLLDRAASRIEPELKDQPRAQAGLLETLSHVYGALGLHREAAALARKSLALDASEHRETEQTSEAALTLGRSLVRLGEFNDARTAFGQALAIRSRLKGENDLGVANILNNIGGLDSQLANNDASIEAHTRALAIQERLRGPEHIAVANSLRGLGVIYSRRKEHEKALDLFQRVLTISEKTYGPGHAVTAGGLEDVAWELKDLNRLTEARPIAERALEVRLKTVGPDHTQTSFTRSMMGELLEAEGKIAEAIQSHGEALRIREASLGPENPRTADTLSALGRLKVKMGDVDEAYRNLSRASQIYEKSYGPSDHRTLEAKKDAAAARDRLTIVAR
jgi:serine/threonine protein kinase